MSSSPYSIAALKRSTMHFLSGKVVSALLTFAILLLLVRLLPVEEYGVYITLTVGMELAIIITALGLPFTLGRFLPEFRLYASGATLTHFVRQIFILISLLLAAGTLILFMTMPWLLQSLGIEQHTNVARLYLLVLLLEGLGIHLRLNALSPLLQQGQAQISQIARNLTLLLLLCIAAVQGAVHLHHVVLAEIVASIAGGALALRGLVKHLHALRDIPGSVDWQPPTWSEKWHVARHMYFSYLVTMGSGPQLFTFLIQRYLGAEATALFGFMRRLFELGYMYLPATLLAELLRPKLVASYVGEGGMTELSRNANLMGKISLFVLMPILSLTWLAGSELLSLLSGGKFTESGHYLAALLLALIPLSQRTILESVAMTCNKSQFCTWASSLTIVALPLGYLLLEANYGIWSVIIAMFTAQIIFNLTVNGAMMHSTSYRVDAIGFFKLMAAGLMSYVLTLLVAHQFSIPTQGLLGLFTLATLAGSFYLLSAYFLKPFRKDELDRMAHLIKHKIPVK